MGNKVWLNPSRFIYNEKNTVWLYRSRLTSSSVIIGPLHFGQLKYLLKICWYWITKLFLAHNSVTFNITKAKFPKQQPYDAAFDPEGPNWWKKLNLSLYHCQKTWSDILLNRKQNDFNDTVIIPYLIFAFGCVCYYFWLIGLATF